MSEDEIINIVMQIKNHQIAIFEPKENIQITRNYFNEEQRNAMQGLLDLYDKEKEKNKELEVKNEWLNNQYDEMFDDLNKLDKNSISKDKIKEKIEQTKKVYEDEMKPYQREYGLDVTYLNKKEKAELINKRNCLLTQIETYKLLLEED